MLEMCYTNEYRRAQKNAEVSQWNTLELSGMHKLLCKDAVHGVCAVNQDCIFLCGNSPLHRDWERIKTYAHRRANVLAILWILIVSCLASLSV